MCLIAMAWGMHPDYPLVIAANRDEWLARPTAPLAQWRTDSGHTVVSGRDLQGGGTWMGFSPHGRFAMLTNVRQGVASANSKATIATTSTTSTTVPSRGHLVTSWLCSSATAHDWAAQQTPQIYEGFNLIVGDWTAQTCHYLTNQNEHGQDASWHTVGQQNAPRSLATGRIFGLSNAALDTPWPKTLKLTTALRAALMRLDPLQPTMPCNLEREDQLFQHLQHTLQDTACAEDADLPHTGVPLALERDLSSVMVRHPAGDPVDARYGTRSSLCALLHRDGRLQLREMTHLYGDATAAAPSLAMLSLPWPA